MTTLASACDTKVVAQLVVKTADKKFSNLHLLMMVFKVCWI